jgi:glycerophosphoryl diester phosphodiesterase
VEVGTSPFLPAKGKAFQRYEIVERRFILSWGCYLPPSAKRLAILYEMRSILAEELNKRTLPLTLAHMCGKGLGKENTLEALKNTLPYKPDILEMDVRKSKDGVLYCHHGSIPFGAALSQVLKVFTLSQIRFLLGRVDTLQELLEAVPSDTIVYLDLKENRISPEDVREALRHCPSRHIWIGAYSFKHLRRMREGLGENYVYMSQHIWWGRTMSLSKVEGLADMVHFLYWQFTPQNIAEAKRLGLIYNILPFATPQKKRKNLKSRYAPIFCGYDDLAEAKEAA